MPFIGILTYCDHDNDVQTFVKVYEHEPLSLMADAYRAAMQLSSRAKVTTEELDEWEGELCQIGDSHVYRVEGDVQTEIEGKWYKVRPGARGNAAVE